MRSRLMRDAVFMALCPFVSVLLIALRWGEQSRCMEIMLGGVAVQVVVTLFCRKGAKLLYAPSRENMLRMGAGRIPAAYEPGKFDRDHKIAGACTFLGAAAPVFGYLAQLYPETVTNAMLDQLQYETANLALLGLALVCTLAGSTALILWVKVGQAMEIANEGSENRRYLLRGFAEAAEDRCFLFDYLHGSCPH